MAETRIDKVARLRAELPGQGATPVAPEGRPRAETRGEAPVRPRRRRVGGPAQLNLRMTEDLLRVLVRVAAEESAREGRMVSAQEVAMAMIERGLVERGLAPPGERGGDG
jgi:hypothetical protein